MLASYSHWGMFRIDRMKWSHFKELCAAARVYCGGYV